MCLRGWYGFGVEAFGLGCVGGEGAWVGSICIQKPDPCPGLVAPLVTHLVPGIGSGSGASKVYTYSSVLGKWKTSVRNSD